MPEPDKISATSSAPAAPHVSPTPAETSAQGSAETFALDAEHAAKEVSKPDAEHAAEVVPAPAKKIYRKSSGRPTGRPPGSITANAKRKYKIARELDKLISKEAKDLLRAALIPAYGATFLFRIEEDENEKGKKVKKHVRLEDPNEMKRALDMIANNNGVDEDEPGHFYYISREKPDYKAIDMLLTRLLGRPKETLDVALTSKFSLVDLAKQREAERALREEEDPIAALPAAPLETGAQPSYRVIDDTAGQI